MTRAGGVDEMGALALLKLVFWGSTIIAALTVDSASSAKVTVSAKSLYNCTYKSRAQSGRLFVSAH